MTNNNIVKYMVREKASMEKPNKNSQNMVREISTY
jgi:hypothetical protein